MFDLRWQLGIEVRHLELKVALELSFASHGFS